MKIKYAKYKIRNFKLPQHNAAYAHQSKQEWILSQFPGPLTIKAVSEAENLSR